MNEQEQTMVETPTGAASGLNAGLGVLFIPDANRKNQTKCCGNFGTTDEFQCMWLAHDEVFAKGSCELGEFFVHDVYSRPSACPLNTPNKS